MRIAESVRMGPVDNIVEPVPKMKNVPSSSETNEQRAGPSECKLKEKVTAGS